MGASQTHDALIHGRLPFVVNKTKSVEKALIRMLIERYQRFGVIGRPVNDSSVVLKVRYGLQIIQILDLDENKQILHTNCWSMYVSEPDAPYKAQKPRIFGICGCVPLNVKRGRHLRTRGFNF